MKTEQINLRLETEIVQMLEHLAKEESLDRATLMRKLLVEAIQSLRLDRSIGKYQEGTVTMGRAAEEAGLTHWELLDELSRRHVAHGLEAGDVEARVEGLKRAISAPSPRGFQFGILLDGKEVLSLADIEPRKGGVLLVGINPAKTSVDAGHYYQGQLGRRLWKRLENLGLLQDAIPGQEDEAFQREGHGITDVVKRPTASSSELTTKELRDGAVQLREKLRFWEPAMILFAFKKAAEVALGTRSVTPGRGPAINGTPTFLLSGPYAAREGAQKIDAEFKRFLRSHKRKS